MQSPSTSWTFAALLKVLEYAWNDVYRDVLGRTERSIVFELRDIRNDWAHQRAFSTDDTYRALDSTHRLLMAVSSPLAGELEQMKTELLRVRFDEQARTQRRRTASTAVDSQMAGGLRPWREVVTPHQDVSSGLYQQAEFAADLGGGGIPCRRRCQLDPGIAREHAAALPEYARVPRARRDAAPRVVARHQPLPRVEFDPAGQGSP